MIQKKSNILVLIPWLLSGGAVFGQTAASKISSELNAANLSGNLKVIIQYAKVPTESDHSNVQAQGGWLTQRMTNVAAGGYTVPGYSLTGLANNPNITHISADHTVQAHLDLAAAATNATTARAQFGVSGTGVGVAVIDSGIGPNSDLTASVVHSEDLTGGDGLDHYGHGTHVAGIIAGSGAASHCATCSRNLQGMAPGASLVNLRVLDANGETTDSVLIAAIDRAIALKAQYNIRVINLSVGRPVYEAFASDPVCQAVEQAWKAGIVVVVAAGNDGRLNNAGNDGYATINAPANDPYVITVGAMKTMGTPTRTDDNIATYSSKGPSLFDGVVKPDLVAPGNKIVSTMPSISTTLTQMAATQIPASYYNSKGTGASSAYYMLSGTSMAAAVVSGAVADLLQAQPYMTPDQVKIRLMTTAYKGFPTYSSSVDPTTGQAFLDYYDAFTRGAGYLDLQAAMSTVTVAAGNSMSPQTQKQLITQSYGMAFNLGSVWFFNSVIGPFNSSSTWSSSAVSANGTIALQANVATVLTSAVVKTVNSTVTNGTSSVWGNSSVWGSSSVWGTSSIWGNSSVWGSSTASASSTLVKGEN